MGQFPMGMVQQAMQNYPGMGGMGGMSPMQMQPIIIPITTQQAPAPAPPPAEAHVPAGPSPADLKIAELEKRLMEERERVLLATLKHKEESVVATRVENSIKDIQDKLRRDKRSAESEEARLKLEVRIQELEGRLAAERETWVATLKGQMKTSEVKDKEIETELTAKLHDLERRWLDEKARWQESLRAKEDELRSARAVLEKLKGVEVENQKLLQEKKFDQERLQQLTQANAGLQARAGTDDERDREFYRLQADLDKTREQLQLVHERSERELETQRSAFREREERLSSDVEKVQAELMSVADRLRAEHETELRRQKTEYEGDLKKARSQLEASDGAIQRMRAVCTALERQAASLREQAEEGRKLKDELQRVNERYKAEFCASRPKRAGSSRMSSSASMSAIRPSSWSSSASGRTARRPSAPRPPSSSPSSSMRRRPSSSSAPKRRSKPASWRCSSAFRTAWRPNSRRASRPSGRRSRPSCRSRSRF